MTEQEAIEHVRARHANGLASTYEVVLAERLAWFREREPYVRALAGATEDASVFSDAVPLSEWRALVDFEMDTRNR